MDVLYWLKYQCYHCKWRHWYPGIRFSIGVWFLNSPLSSREEIDTTRDKKAAREAKKANKLQQSRTECYAKSTAALRFMSRMFCRGSRFRDLGEDQWSGQEFLGKSQGNGIHIPGYSSAHPMESSVLTIPLMRAGRHVFITASVWLNVELDVQWINEANAQVLTTYCSTSVK